jgi:hypothetical protein
MTIVEHKTITARLDLDTDEFSEFISLNADHLWNASPSITIEMHPSAYAQYNYQFSKEQFDNFISMLLEFQKVINETIQSQTK